MGRRRLGLITAVVLGAVAAPAGAAEITRTASRGEPGNPFDLNLSVRWDRLQERARITREVPQTAAAPGSVVDADELRYTRTVNSIVPRIAVAIAEDLELHVEWPYVLGDDRSWRFGLDGGAPTGGNGQSSIEQNAIDAQGQPCAIPCPLFPVAPSTTVFHGGRSGDFQAGVAWGIFNDRKDPTKPFWQVGLDVTFPTAALYDPARDRGTDWSSPYNISARTGPFGEKVWKWDLHTTLSRRLGPIDPYVKAHATLMSRSGSTYSNCDHADALSTVSAGNPVRQMTSAAAVNCRDSGAAADAAADLPWIAGLTFGTEFVPYESRLDQQKLSIDLRLAADYVSAARFYNELTDASGRLHRTEEHLTLGGFLGLYLRASKYVALHASASLATKTPHFLTGEALGRNGGWPALDPSGNGLTADPGAMNPNFDWRYDAPGRRFRISEVALFQISFGGVLTF